MKSINRNKPEVLRHRTAIRRRELSLPLKCLLRDGLLEAGNSLFDYGCGHGDDVRHIRSLGHDCDGWDPVHRPDVPRRAADVVNLGFVLNVIEDVPERAETLRNAWQLCQKLLLVAARISGGENGGSDLLLGDGSVTRLGTFQKYYNQAELRDYIQQVLEEETFPAAPGVFYVFRDRELRERYFDGRYRRRVTVPRKRDNQSQYEAQRTVLEPLMARASELARLPLPEELPESASIIGSFGSLKRAFSIVLRASSIKEWEILRQDRTNDLLVYLAMSRFRKLPPASQLPSSLQQDFREFFGSYRKACRAGEEMLFKAGQAEAIDAACQRSKIGRLAPNALYVHKSAIPMLEPILRIYEGCAQAYLGEIADVNVVKLHRFSGKISYLACPDFDTAPHPAIRRSVKLRMGNVQLDCLDHSADDNPLLLDRKELLVDVTYRGRDKFAHLSEQEEAYGLLENVTDLLSQSEWDTKLGEAGLRLRGHRLIRRPGAKPKRKTVRRQPAAETKGRETTPAGENSQSLSMEPTRGHSRPRLRISKKPSLPGRSAKYGIGKQIASSVYVHRQYEALFGVAVASAKICLPGDFVYDVVKYNQRTKTVSFIQCPEFDSIPEPSIHEVIVVRTNGTILRRRTLEDPHIYHHKWLFVADDYDGFDVDESKRRSQQWLGLPNVDKSRIGYRSYWESQVVPRLNQQDFRPAREDEQGGPKR